MAKTPKKVDVPKGYKEVKGGDLVLFSDEGDFVEGRYIGVEEKVGKHESSLYSYTDRESKDVKSFFGSVVVDRLMGKVEVGNTFKLVYVGKVKATSGRKVKDFRLFVKK